MWQITARTGDRRGFSWIVGDRPITLGRSLTCDIVVSDPTVSRRHCEIVCEKGRLLFRDLGSRNVTHVNGRVVGECYLDVGDELSIGTDLFLMTQASSVAITTPGEAPKRDDTTATLSFAVERGPDERLNADVGCATSAQDMVRLFQLSQQLRFAGSIHEFATICLLAIQHVFPRPAEAFLCLRSENKELRVYPRGCALPSWTSKEVGGAITSGRSVLKLQRKFKIQKAGQLCVSPLRSEGAARAAMVVTCPVRDIVLEEEDLVRLDAIANVAELHLSALLTKSDHLGGEPDPENIEPEKVFGESESAKLLRAGIRTAAKCRLNALIVGETGTGKDFASQMIYEQSPPPRGAYIVARCEDICGPQFQRVLVGEERPAADSGCLIEAGLLDQANGGTLVLREIGALTLENQRLLFHVLTSHAFTRVGGTAAVVFSGRLISTSRTELEFAVQGGRFRSDLLTLISRLRLGIAPLRERRADIRTLAQHYLGLEKRNTGRRVAGLSEDALKYLEDMPFFGNATELHETIAHAVRRGRGEMLESQDLFALEKVGVATSSDAELRPLEHAEQLLIAAVIRQSGNDLAKASRILGIPLVEVERVSRQTAKTR